MGEALSEGLYAWRPGRADTDEAWTPIQWCDPGEGAIVAADSWRVLDGRVRGLDRHRDRFLCSAGRAIPPERSSASAASELRWPENSPHSRAGRARVPELVHADPDRLPHFWHDVVAALPRTGDWFPRIELRERGTLTLRVRPTPPTSTQVVVATAPYDPRTAPTVKGPDLDALLALRTAVQPVGASEAIILDAHGHLIDGAYSALLWWRDGVLCSSPDTRARIPSVTAALILDAAAHDGIPTRRVDVTARELDGAELWVASALHGVRLATAWVEGPSLTSVDGRIDWARTALQKSEHLLPSSV